MKKVALWVVSAWAIWGQERPWTEEYPERVAAANKACRAGEQAECRKHLLRLKELVDGRGDVIYRLARVEAALGNQAAGLEWLELYSRMGLRLADPANDPAFAGWKDNAAFSAALRRLAAAARPVTGSAVFATLPEKELIPEDLAYDPADGRFFVSSVRQRKILALDREGKFSDFTALAEAPVMALAADAARRWLWATTAENGKSAVLKYSLDTGKLLRRYDPPAGEKHEMGDMTVSAAGDAFISDGLGSLYRIARAADRLELLFGPGTFRSPQTPAVTPDGRRLFVPDYSRGIAVVDLATRGVSLLPHPADLSLGGIDGLYLAGGTMVAVQNGTAPERLIRMRLDEGLTRVVEWSVIEANWPGLGDPTHGVVVKDQFYFIANSGWDVKPGGTFEAATIRRMAWR